MNSVLASKKKILNSTKIITSKNIYQNKKYSFTYDGDNDNNNRNNNSNNILKIMFILFFLLY